MGSRRKPTVDFWWQNLQETFGGPPWSEYPDTDREYVTVYPTSLGEIDPANIWAKRPICCYVHIPFCKHICDFCFFLEYPANVRRQEMYLAALKREIDMYAKMPYVQDSIVVALYFGGGTPSVLTGEQLGELIDYIRNRIPFAQDAEIEVEAHPLTVDKEKLELLRSKGVTRVSFGVQSFKDDLLKAIGSPHHGEDAIRAIELAHEVGFPKVALDLMFNKPGETTEDWIYDIETAMSLNPTSVSCYRFSVVPRTPLFKRISDLSSKMRDARGMYELWEETVRQFTSKGYYQYTCTCFAKPGGESRYVLGAWKAPQLEVLGFGAGAVSFAMRGHVYINIHNLREYMEVVNTGRLPVLMGKRINLAEWMSRYVVLGVRAMEVSKDKFAELFGFSMDEIYAKELQYLRDRNLIVDDQHTLNVTTPHGSWYIDNISKRFFTPNNVRKPQPLWRELINVELPAVVRESSLQFRHER
jgi:oxygen-independent coproporphyrinogen-3 oxidase